MHDLVIRNGTVVDGTGATGVRADLAIEGDRIVRVGEVDGSAARTLDAEGCMVTPGFVEIHTHLDAQVYWDSLLRSSCWHGVTSAVMGNCGVTFAPCRPKDRAYLASLMESVEDIPAASIMEGLHWNWETYGEFLQSLDALPKGINVGGMVGHCALRIYAMGERGLKQHRADPDDVERMCALLDDAIAGGALGFSTSRLLSHRTPEGDPVPGTFAEPEELMAFGRVLKERGRGVFEVVNRLDAEPDVWPSEFEWMTELGKQSGRPITFAFVQNATRPGAWRSVLEQVQAANAEGARFAPQTSPRAPGVLFGLQGMTPFDDLKGAEDWKRLRKKTLGEKLEALKRPESRARLLEQANAVRLPRGFLARTFLLRERAEVVRYDFAPEDAVDVIGKQRGVSGAQAFVDLSLEQEGRALFFTPGMANPNLEEVRELLSVPDLVFGLTDSGAHVGQIMDSNMPTFLLSYWVRERGLLGLEEAVRKLSSEPARLFGLKNRGELRVGAAADVNVIDLERLGILRPELVHDFPLGAERYVQRSQGIRHTIVNGEPFLENGEHTGAFAGQVLRGNVPKSVNQERPLPPL